MKTSRLLVYGLLGIVGGLLIENRALIFKHDARKTAGKIKKKLKAVTPQMQTA